MLTKVSSYAAKAAQYCCLTYSCKAITSDNHFTRK